MTYHTEALNAVPLVPRHVFVGRHVCRDPQGFGGPGGGDIEVLECRRGGCRQSVVTGGDRTLSGFVTLILAGL